MDGNNILSMDKKNEETEIETVRGLINLSDLEGIKKKYKEVYEVTAVVDEDDETEGRKLIYYFKKPSVASFNRYLKSAGKNMAAATTTFVLDNIVEEQLKPFEKECESYPGLALNFGQKLLSAIGLGDNINFRKL